MPALQPSMGKGMIVDVMYGKGARGESQCFVRVPPVTPLASTAEIAGLGQRQNFDASMRQYYPVTFTPAAGGWGKEIPMRKAVKGLTPNSNGSLYVNCGIGSAFHALFGLCM